MFKKMKSFFLLCLLIFSAPAFADTPVALTYGTGITGQNIPASPVTVTNGPSTLLPSTLYADGAVITPTNPLPIAGEPKSAILVEGTATAAGSTTIGTPPVSSNLRDLIIDVSENVTQTTAGEDTIVVALNGVTVYSTSVYVPAGALTSSGILSHIDIGFSGTAFNTGSAGTLTVTLGTALATGNVQINAYFD